MRAVLSHFSKMKHLDLSTSDNECVIKFYKDVTPEYIVSGLFLFFFSFLVKWNFKVYPIFAGDKFFSVITFLVQSYVFAIMFD